MEKHDITTQTDIQKQILHVSREYFLKYGYSKVTTDEIASSIGISKKTLYKHFPTKKALLEKVISSTIEGISAKLEPTVTNDKVDFVDKLKGVMEIIANQTSQISQQFVNDIRNMDIGLWNMANRLREEKVMSHFGRLLKLGVKEGYIRDDINPEMLKLIYMNSVQSILTPHRLYDLPISAKQGFEMIFKVFFEGALTERARRRYLATKSSLTESNQTGEL
ncbi:MAG: TetR family transcriptional regulator [candidate division Zixibacteria bacterium]|nr:TetR family transcriptional regulator [candidate division Zixibacteria bacterium]